MVKREKQLPRNVEVDISGNPFREQAASLTEDRKKALMDTIRQITSMTWEEVYRSKGLNWEEISTVRPPRHLGIDAWYSIRYTGEYRARVYRSGNIMRFVDLPPTHDATYKKR